MKSSNSLTKQDIKVLSAKIASVSAKIDKNQKALNQLAGVSKKMDDVSDKIDRNQNALDQLDEISAKIDRNQKALDQLDDVGRILRENEQNLKDLGGLKHRLDTLDKIMVTVDKIAGSIQTYQQEQTLNSNKLSTHDDRLEKIEKHLHFSTIA
jgi:chromosome segregation ATPase